MKTKQAGKDEKEKAAEVLHKMLDRVEENASVAAGTACHELAELGITDVKSFKKALPVLYQESELRLKELGFDARSFMRSMFTFTKIGFKAL